ncbi:MAG TPA: flavodoxin [Salinivirgaceae bacterium]|nr:flavodoxin [Salinivirgaceae bacterium]
MKKIALIYSFRSNKTAAVAKKIKSLWEDKIHELDIETLTVEQFVEFENYILGVPTWFDGELPSYWDEFVPAMEDMDLTGRKFAIFGNGDQVNYPENFGDAVGIMAEIIESLGGTIIGYTSSKGYVFEKSQSLVGERFCGLLLDFENQPKQNEERVVSWIESLKKEFQ